MSSSNYSVYKFGPFSVDAANLTLTKSGSIIHVPAKTLETLLILIRRRPEVLDKDYLIKQLWPDTFVQEINLTVHISRLRKVLGDGPGDHRYIVTVPKRGYGFVAPVDEVDQENWLDPVVADELHGFEAPTNGDLSNGRGSQSASDTTRVSKSSNDGPPVRRPSHKYRLPRSRFVVMGVAITSVLAFIYLIASRQQSSSVQYSYRKIAVLPFHFVGAPEDGYLAAGISSAIVARLSKTNSNLVVQPTSLIASVPGKGVDSVAEGRKLGVDAVVDGTMEQSGNGLRLTARFLRVRDGKILWVGGFDVTAANAVDVRDLI
ncbi:MAG TPA: winged helix-turn-helix domain-containing protein, partial [Blastocatellia bacterium]|nr:winged helix-turn-helix domain-containing protein [Blastocatellia bacterium]